MIIKYIRKKRAKKAKENAEIEARFEERERESEARILQEKNRMVLTVPDTSIKNILGLYDAYCDDEHNRNMNKYFLWKKIESVLPETKEGNWYFDIRGSNVIKIKQVFSEVQGDLSYHYRSGYEYGDAFWPVTNKKLD